NPHLLRNAAEALAPHSVQLRVGDLNEADFGEGPYDLILCASALHHLVELELVVKGIVSSLGPHGEFWSIGEYIGRNGARLWPDVYGAANQFFRGLPERLRRNHALQTVDVDLPNMDCSAISFESIRSEEIEGILSTCLTVDWLDRRSVLLWRLF